MQFVQVHSICGESVPIKHENPTCVCVCVCVCLLDVCGLQSCLIVVTSFKQRITSRAVDEITLANRQDIRWKGSRSNASDKLAA